MKKNFLTSEKPFYKAGMHTHTTVSDGRFSPEETKKKYQEQGYSIAAFTDHEVLRLHNDLTDKNFLMLTSYEYSVDPGGKMTSMKKMCHLNLYARDPFQDKQICYDSQRYFVRKFKEKFNEEIKFIGKDRPRGYSQAEVNHVIDTAKRNGFIVCYNHPEWSNETVFDYIGYNGFFAMEVYNHSSYVDSHSTSEEWNIQGYDMLLRAGRRVFPIFSDDAHNPDIHAKVCDGFGGFIMVNADKLEYNTVFNALEKGDFYASMAPEIYDLYFENGKMCVHCSPVKEIQFYTAGRLGRRIRGEFGENVTYAEYEPCEDFGFIRVELSDENGKKATTRGYFADELTEDE